MLGTYRILVNRNIRRLPVAHWSISERNSVNLENAMKTLAKCQRSRYKTEHNRCNWAYAPYAQWMPCLIIHFYWKWRVLDVFILCGYFQRKPLLIFVFTPYLSTELHNFIYFTTTSKAVSPSPPIGRVTASCSLVLLRGNILCQSSSYKGNELTAS
jgi:hypothetical protein